ncbi:MAG: deoxyguanosinetriphosphate triphosphohydrolase [Clostridiales bacterium]|nr:deoxyguanosinetriphosphate triphosphohydrolase [Clostridiales bacterium]
MKSEQLEFERIFLSKYATKSENTKGRAVAIEPCPYRTEFQRDRDRIIHCKAFRRLKHKTQVFLSANGDHYRTRLTHTLEVTQIARTIARALCLNEDLTEAIALGHDLGHTPFGHAGERVLNSLTGHFYHNEQSLRVVEFLENEGKGLNLTFEVRDGILNHTSKGNPSTLEAKIVSCADRIAYINHDINDAIRAGVLKDEDLPKDCVEFLGRTQGERINTLVSDMIKNSYQKPDIMLSKEGSYYMNKLREFMFDYVYNSTQGEMLNLKADRMISTLFRHFLKYPGEVPKNYVFSDNATIFVTDFIASMTDTYAINIFKELYIPKEYI